MLISSGRSRLLYGTLKKFKEKESKPRVISIQPGEEQIHLRPCDFMFLGIYLPRFANVNMKGKPI